MQRELRRNSLGDAGWGAMARMGIVTAGPRSARLLCGRSGVRMHITEVLCSNEHRVGRNAQIRRQVVGWLTILENPHLQLRFLSGLES